VSRTGEILARLTIHAPTFGAVGRDTSGQTLRVEDVAAACAGLTYPQHALLRLKYCQEAQWLHPLHGVVITEIMRHPLTASLSVPEAGWSGMAEMAVQQAVVPEACARCAGRGHQRNRQGVERMCLSCGGTGRQAVSSRQRAARAGIPWTTWRRGYEELQRAMEQRLHDWEMAGLQQVRRRLQSGI
jgi:hypothetical protein